MNTYFKWIYIAIIHLAIVFAIAGEWESSLPLAFLCFVIALQNINFNITNTYRNVEEKPKDEITH